MNMPSPHWAVPVDHRHITDEFGDKYIVTWTVGNLDRMTTNQMVSVSISRVSRQLGGDNSHFNLKEKDVRRLIAALQWAVGDITARDLQEVK